MENASVERYDLLHRLGAGANDIDIRSLKLGKKQTAHLSASPFELAEILLSYRIAMCVTEIMIFNSSVFGETGYYICPRCNITMDREFVSFCGRCGQHLDWKDYRRAKVVSPGEGPK